MSRAALVANLPDQGRKQDHKMDSVDLNLKRRAQGGVGSEIRKTGAPHLGLPPLFREFPTQTGWEMYPAGKGKEWSSDLDSLLDSKTGTENAKNAVRKEKMP